MIPSVQNLIPWIHTLKREQLYFIRNDFILMGTTLFCTVKKGKVRRNDYSTVTLFAKFLGLSTSRPRWTAMW